MSPLNLFYLILFWSFQIVANLMFKYGAVHPPRQVVSFIGGHLFGVTSIIFMMIMYKTLHTNVVNGLCFGGAFLLAQIALAVAYRTGMTPVQMTGVLVMTVGMALLVMGRPAVT